MYVIEIMEGGVSHGYEYHEDEISYDESDVTLLDEKGREIVSYSLEDEVALIDETNLDLRDWRALVRLATNGSIGWYQAWEAGEWTSPDPVPLFALFMANGDALGETARARGPFASAAGGSAW